MATSSKFDVSSSSPDRPLYTGQRGSQVAASLDRSGSFRESMENPILSSLPNMSRSSSSVTQGDVTNFFKHLRFDPKLVAAEHKSLRQVDLKRHVNVALGLPPEESSPSSAKGKLVATPVPEEIRRVKTGLCDSLVKARQRGKTFSEALSVFNKLFPSIPSKKRSRSECFSNDRSSVLLSDRSVLGPSGGKAGVQGHAVTGGYELEQQKTEERMKNLVPNKRTRTSLVDVRMDVRTNSLIRPSGTVDRDKELLRLASNSSVQGEERTLPLGGDGWEKSRMKKKRSCIKPDGSPSAALTKPIDAFQESKQGIQQRLVTDTRSKLSNDSHSFRSAVSNGTVGAGKSDGTSQQTGLGVRASTPRNDQDNSSLISDRRDRPINSDKERVNFRAVNKSSVRDEFNSASPTSNPKMHTSIRAPRSGSGVAPKLSSVVPKAAVSNDWELSHCTTKPPAGVGMSNRKRVASARSSSPPVAHWAAQRPQKNSRTARRPIVSSNDDSPALDAVSDVAGNDLGLGFARRLAGSSSQQIKLKGDPLSSATALSESEESGVAEIKSKDKGRKSDEIDQKAGQSVQKFPNLVLSTRKNKLVSGEEQGDGVRRHGRTGRGFTSTGSLMPITSEKLGNVGTAKQLRSARLGFEKSESKAGRPPTRKLSDRKAYTRQKHVAINAAADFLVGSDDGHEELLAAANGVINSACAFSSPFWKQMEPFFGWISDEDINYWKQKEKLESSAPVPTPVSSNVDGFEAVNGFALIDGERDVGFGIPSNAGVVPEQSHLSKVDHNVIPLCQRVMAALISEEDFGSGSEDFSFDAYETEYEPDGELELGSLDHHLRVDTKFSCHSAYNGHTKTGKLEYDETECDMATIPMSGLNANLGNSTNGSLQDKALFPSLICSELQYDSLDMNEKLLLELQSIGIFPEPLPDMLQKDDEGICGDIARLEENYQGQVSKKKGLMDRLMKSASMTKELQKKEFEQNALDKLLVMAYEKYMACRGPGSSSGKSSSNKMAKQALAFVKRTLDRCHQFEDTGKSCFSESLFMDMYLASSSQLSTVQVDGREGELSRQYPSLSLEARTASMGSQQSPSQFSQNMDNHDFNSSDVLPTSDQTSGKEDLWSNRVKKRELPLDDVGGSTVTSSAPSGIGNSLSISAKGKRSERERDGKGHSRDVRNGSTKVGRPALSCAKGERKSKTKPKQKATPHSVSVNGLVGKLSEQSQPSLPSVSKLNDTSDRNAKKKDEYGMGVLDDPEPIDLSHLQLPGMDVLGDDLGGQGQEDLSSWFNIDDEALQDEDFVGLEIPMDDLADLNIRV